jgi:hypothetical protein
MKLLDGLSRSSSAHPGNAILEPTHHTSSFILGLWTTPPTLDYGRRWRRMMPV